MSFHFNWKAFAHEESFQAQIRDLLTNALNKQRPRILEGQIRVLNLDWGTEAPTLEMLEIGDVAGDRFRGIFKLQYTGSASITIATKVQANLLNVYAATAPSQWSLPHFVGAPVSFTIPLHLSLSEIRLQGIVIVVFSKTKGLTLVFRNDPLQSIKVSSTFDTLPGIPTLLQTQIENQIRALFREELPGVLYRFSLQWTPAGREALLEHSGHRGQENLLPPPSLTPLGAIPIQREDQKVVTFAEIDANQQVSLVNQLHVDALFTSRRTLSLSTLTIPLAIVRPELHRLESRRSTAQIQIWDQTLNGESFEHIRSRVSQAAARVSQPRRRRVIRLRRQDSTDTDSSLHNLTTSDLPTMVPRHVHMSTPISERSHDSSSRPTAQASPQVMSRTASRAKLDTTPQAASVDIPHTLSLRKSNADHHNVPAPQPEDAVGTKQRPSLAADTKSLMDRPLAVRQTSPMRTFAPLGLKVPPHTVSTTTDPEFPLYHSGLYSQPDDLPPAYAA